MDQTSELPPSGNPQELKAPLSPSQIQLRSFFRGSFRYAQGSLAAQSFITEWAYSSGKMPHLEIPKKMPDYIKDLMPPGNHIISSSSRTNTDRQDAWEDLHRTSREQEFIDPSKSLKSVLNEVLRRELKYQLIGRRGRSTDQDAYDSYLRRFVILGEASNSPILDDLSAELEGEIAELLDEPTSPVTPDTLGSREISSLKFRFKKGGQKNIDEAEGMMTQMGSRRMLSLVEALWETNHPGQRFFPDAAQALI